MAVIIERCSCGARFRLEQYDYGQRQTHVDLPAAACAWRREHKRAPEPIPTEEAPDG